MTPQRMKRFWSILAVAASSSVAAVAAENFTGDAALIANLRAESNQAIAAHQSARVASFLTEDVHITTGSGATLDGRDVVRKKFETLFTAQRDLAYVRTPARIELSRSAPLAAEQGKWTGHWTDAGKSIEATGEYFAMWRRTGDTWLIRSELFVTLVRLENGVPVQPK